jgi:hypothetical protein
MKMGYFYLLLNKIKEKIMPRPGKEPQMKRPPISCFLNYDNSGPNINNFLFIVGKIPEKVAIL